MGERFLRPFREGAQLRQRVAVAELPLRRLDRQEHILVRADDAAAAAVALERAELRASLPTR